VFLSSRAINPITTGYLQGLLLLLVLYFISLAIHFCCPTDSHTNLSLSVSTPTLTHAGSLVGPPSRPHIDDCRSSPPPPWLALVFLGRSPPPPPEMALVLSARLCAAISPTAFNHLDLRFPSSRLAPPRACPPMARAPPPHHQQSSSPFGTAPSHAPRRP
jgi:hypothetical protein